MIRITLITLGVYVAYRIVKRVMTGGERTNV